ncbi:hypothetical protein GQ53DRAFT_851511 [Thozetella sp. PMI_491]|nr:hypothetical protein GQ53DRAFT_851511 [Thozetella sp. PMI_491]
MRLSLVLTLSGLLPLAKAYGPRAAAEKAGYYLTYIMEEAYGDSSKYTVAVDCPGSRAGGRCTLLEFCDYLWKDRTNAKTGATYGDTKPDKSKVTMTEPSLSNLDATKIYGSIMGAKQGSKPMTKIEFGYIGAVDGDKLIGESDWYKATVAIGDSMREAAQACREAIDQDKWGDFPDRLEDASKLTLDMRNIDNAKVEMDEKNGLTKYAGGRYVESVKYEPLSDIFHEVWPQNVLQVSDEDTIEAWQQEGEIGADGKEVPALSEDDARSLLNKARTDFNDADGNLHKMAIEAGQEMEKRRGLSCGTDSSDDDSSSGSDSDSDSDSGSDSD